MVMVIRMVSRRFIIIHCTISSSIRNMTIICRCGMNKLKTWFLSKLLWRDLHLRFCNKQSDYYCYY
uniref:Ovule protein n=1 Tax=Schistosoma curassoni TaxID=6186 RepID=A0A183KRR9_9TREM